MPQRLYRVLPRVSAFMFLLLPLSAAHAWSTEEQLSSTSGASGKPAIAIDTTGRIHTVYSAPMGGTLQLQHRSRLGLTWSSPVDLPGPAHKETDPSMAIDTQNHLHVVASYRVDGTTNTPYSVYYWFYDGTTWTGPTAISSTSGNDNNNRTGAAVAVDKSGDLHVVYSEDGHGGQGDIMYTRKQAGVWSTPKNLTNNGTQIAYGSVSPDIAIDKNGNNIHVVWHDDSDGDGFKVWYQKNPNLGDPASWSAWTLLSYQYAGGDDYGKSPRVFVDRNNNPNAIWTDKFGGSTNVTAYSRLNGAAWTVPTSWGTIAVQDIVFDPSNLMHILYTDDPTGTTELYYKEYDFTTFTTQELISTGTDTLKVDFGSLALDQYNIAQTIWNERKGAWPGTGYVFYSARGIYNGPTGTLAGTVRDQANNPVGGASVAGPSGFSTITAANGTYLFTMPVGTWSVTATKAYYGSQTVNNVVISQNQTTTQNFAIAAQSPNPPTNLVVTPGNTSAHLTWVQSSSANATGTTIRYRTGQFPTDPTDGILATEVSGSGSKSYDQSGLTNGVTYYFAAFAHDADGHYSVPATASGTAALKCDFDHDGDVDQSDFAVLQICLSGANISQFNAACANALLDADFDVDNADVDKFSTCFSGADMYANPTCLN